VTDLARLSPLEFVSFLRREKIRRFDLVRDPKDQTVRSSHPQIQLLAEFIGSDWSLTPSSATGAGRSSIPWSPAAGTSSLKPQTSGLKGNRAIWKS